MTGGSERTHRENALLRAGHAMLARAINEFAGSGELADALALGFVERVERAGALIRGGEAERTRTIPAAMPPGYQEAIIDAIQEGGWPEHRTDVPELCKRLKAARW